MRILSVTCEDFCGHKRAAVDLRAVSLALVTGANGAGKSSLLVDAPLWALYGEARGATLADVVRRGAKTARVELELELGGAAYRVVRAYTIKGKTGATLLELWRHEAGQWAICAAGGVAEVQAAIVALLGLSAQALTVASVVRQGEASALTLATPGERLAALLEVCGGAHLSGLASQIGAQIRDAEAKRATCEALAQRARADLASAEARHTDRAPLVERLEREAKALDAEALAAARDAWRASCDELERAREASALDKRLASLLDAIRTGEEVLIEVCREAAELDAKQAALPAVDVASAEAIVDLHEERLAGLLAARSQAERHIQEAARIEAIRAERTAALTRLDDQRQRAAEAAAKIPGECKASMCGARLYVAALAAGDTQRAQRDLAELEVEQRAEAARALLVAGEALAAAKRCEVTLERGALAALDFALHMAQRDLGAAKGAVKVERAALEERGAMMRRRAQLASQESLARRTLEHDAEQAEDARELGAVEDMAARAAVVSAAEDAHLDASKAYEAARRDYDAGCAARDGLAAARAAQLADAEAARRARDEVERLAQALAVEVERARVATLARDFLRAAPLVAVARALPRLEVSANEILADLAPNMALRLSTARTSRKGDLVDALTITLEVAGRAAPVETLSGGERFRVDLALRLALARLASGRAVAPVQTLIIDEGFGALDEAGCMAAVEALAALQRRFALILAISHVEGMRGLLPGLEVERGATTTVKTT